MADPRPFTNVDPATADAARRRGRDPHELDAATEEMLTYIYSLLPRRPVSSKGRLTAFVAASDGVDRISLLPGELLRTIVYHLPAKDAARTAVLSSHWCALWFSTPLVLSDTHLLREGHRWPPTPADSPAVTAAVSHILEAHPGPFHCVHLVCSHMNAYRAQLARWLQLLAAKGVQDLVLVNRPWPRAVPLPATLFSITTLTRLYVGVWKLPDTAALRGASFPHLRELGICCVLMEDGDVDSLVSRSPVLETLNIQGCMEALRLGLASQSLRCVQIGGSNTENITVVDAPRLERLILYGHWNFDRLLCTSIRIGHAPKLHTFGFLDPKKHVLEIRDTMIMAGIKVSRRAMVTSVKILNLHVCFGVYSDIKIVPTFLRCFPNVERLHITSGKCDQSTGDLGLKSWEDFGPIKDVLSRIGMLTFHEFRGEQSEVAFLELFFQSTRALEAAVIVLADPSFTPFSVDEALSKLKECSKKIASKSHQVLVCEGEGPKGAEPWTFQTGADFSCQDPFSLVVAVS